MTNNWRPLPERQRGERLARNRFKFLSDPHVARYTCQFRHHDNRIWTSTIEAIDNDDINRMLGREFYYSIRLASQGCRSFQFVAHERSRAEDITRRFANINPDRYDRLVADAKGTSSHPMSDDIGVFRLFVTKQNPLSYDRATVVREQITGIGRVNGFNFVIFPTSEEIDEHLSRICPAGVEPIVPPGINQIGVHENSTFTQGSLHASTREPAEFDSEALHAALTRNFNDTFETITERIQSGEYQVRRREARAIDFGDDDDD